MKIWLLILMTVAGCAEAQVPATIQSARQGDYTMALLAWEARPYSHYATDYYQGLEHDAAGLLVVRVDGKAVNHPQVQAQVILCSLAFYRETGRPEYLARAERLAVWYLVQATRTPDGALWFAYDFPFALHGSTAPASQMRPPWFSAMAQGQWLSACTRLFEVTGNPVYIEAAERIFWSFLAVRGDSGPWVTRVDPDDFLWLEEYPTGGPAPNGTLNGMIYAIFGLYDYWLKTREQGALTVLQAAIFTVEKHLDGWRNPGGLSAYCLAHRATSPTYHAIHLDQLRTLGRMTGCPAFAAAAETWLADGGPGK